jgi:DNA-binding NtrC family response regulator
VIAASAAMVNVVKQLKKLSAEDTPLVFLQGEVGSGKEFLARVLHSNSHNHIGPFVSVNCTEQNTFLLEAKIFGYERGAFSGANEAMAGALEHAHGGTVLIDGLEHLPLPVQESLSEAVESGFYCRMGGHDRLTLDARLVLASTTPVVEPDPKNVFHPKILSHLRANQIAIPPLRVRQEDIVPLTLKILQTYGEEIGRGKLDIDASVPPLLMNFPFPGNIRELEALIKRAVLCSQKSVLTSLDFFTQPSTDNGGELAPNMVRIEFELGRRSLSEIQSMVVQEVLRLSNQDKDLAAHYLHVSPQTLDKQPGKLGRCI